MAGVSSVVPLPSEGVPAFSSPREEEEADSDIGFLVDQALSCSPPSSPDSLSPDLLPLAADWQDSSSPSDGVSQEMEALVSAALSSRSLAPLLKEELRCKIQLRRLQHGDQEMRADFSAKPSAMSLEEVVKKNRKMQQNRVSAQRSRERQKDLEKTITSRLELLQHENKVLSEQAQSLRHACHVARDWLHQHQCRACTQRATDSHTGPCGMRSSAEEVPLPGLPSIGESCQLSCDASSLCLAGSH